MNKRTRQHNTIKRGMLTVTAAALISGCSMQAERPYGDAKIRMQQLTQQLEAGTILVDGTRIAGVPMSTDFNGDVWVPLEHAARALNLQLRDMRDGYAIGDTDVLYQLRMDDRNAKSGSRLIQLPDAPRAIGGKPCMTADSLTALLETPINWSSTTRELNIAPIKDTAISSARRGISMQMAETDELQNDDSETEDTDGDYNMQSGSSAAKAVATARKLVGTPYDFGAANYKDTKRFDCSSFTQYVYNKVGVSLPRSSREQSQKGSKIASKNLKAGDLLYFYTPGRYESNKIVGHVSIYIGGGKMIHTYGDPGVVIDEFNDYWKDRFLFAKRVL